MRLVTADEAVAGIRSGQQLFVHGGAATPSRAPRRARRASPGAADVGIIHIHTEGPAPHLAPEMAASFRHRALFIGANARAAVNEGRADYVPVFLSDVPELFSTRGPTARRGAHQRLPAGRARLLLAGHERRCGARRHPRRRTVIAQLNPSMPRTLGRLVRARRPDRPRRSRSTSHRTSTPSRRVGDVERRIGEYVAELVPDRRDDPDGDRLDPGRCGARPAGQARPRGAYRAVHRSGPRPRRGRRRDRRGEGDQPRKDRHRLPHGQSSGCTTSSTTTR